MTRQTIPVIDFRLWHSKEPSQKNSFAKQVSGALNRYGFFALENHTFPLLLLEDVRRMALEFFSLPKEVKEKYEEKALNGQRGYVSFGKEHAKGNDAPDLKEFYHIGDIKHYVGHTYAPNIYPSEISDIWQSDFMSYTNAAFQGMKKIAHSVLEAAAFGLGLPQDSFAGSLDGGDSILRLLHYPPIPEEKNPNSIRAGAHEDINLITLLAPVSEPGLEIEYKGEWMPVMPSQDHIIIDAADMLQHWTNGYYRSVSHRVVNPKSERTLRYSMPFFTHPRGNTEISPLSQLVERTGGKAYFPNRTARQYLEERLKEIGLS